ncbi:MAG: hypothetical protein K0R31_2437 [Clostridiales bacterium]|jgi:hypothetical protein|nr:hypothetical protein [Clostridiales bacterium]
MIVVDVDDWYNNCENGGLLMKQLRTRWSIIAVSVLAALCIVALYISFNIAKVDYQRKTQVIIQKPGLNNEKPQASGKIIQAGKINEQSLYFNGKLIEGVSSYKTDKQGLLLPIDDIFGLANIKFNYFASDDIFEATINNKKLTMKVGQNSVIYGSVEYKLPVIPVAAKDHILVPLELFTLLDGFKASGYEDRGIAFLNYSGDYNNNKLTNLKVLRLQSGYTVISSVDEKKEFWSSRTSEVKNVLMNGIDIIEQSRSGDDYLIKTKDMVFLIRGSSPGMPIPINISPAAAWSLKDNYLYWQDETDKNSYIYDVGKGVSYVVGNLYDRIIERNGSNSTLADFHSLSSFTVKNGAKAISLLNLFTGDRYSSIEKRGKIIIEDIFDYSPNNEKILFQKDGKFYSAGIDGSNVSTIGAYDSVFWINNNRLVAYAEGNAYLMDYLGRNKIKTESAWKFIGESLEGGAFFTGENALYIEKDGKERKIMELPWDCSYAFAQKEAGPYILQTVRGDGIYFTDGTMLVKSGKNSDLLKILKDGEFTSDFRKSIVLSPGGDTTAILQRENAFVSISLVKPDGYISQKIVLNEIVSNKSEIKKISLKWLSNTRLLVNTDSHGWIIDIGEEVYISEWNENSQSIIKGFIAD